MSEPSEDNFVIDKKRKNAERMRLKRANETVEEAEQRKAQEAERKRAKRATETSEEEATRKAQEAERKRAERASESTEKSLSRKGKNADRSRARIAEESAESREMRREADSQRNRLALQRESQEQRESRLAAMSERQRESLEKETPEARELRLQVVSQRQRDTIQAESQEDREARLKSMAIRQNMARAMETLIETEARLTAQLDRQRALRQNETQEQRDTRVGLSASQQSERRAAETAEERKARQVADVTRKNVKRSNETSDSRATRLSNRSVSRSVSVRKKSAAQKAQVFQNSQVDEHYAGKMDVVCDHCGACFFGSEVKTPSSKIMRCCSKGSIKLALPFVDYPDRLKQLFTEDTADCKNFRSNIRQFNSSMSMASLGAQIDHLPGGGPYSFRIHGQLYHHVGPLHPQPGTRRSYGQIYFLDTLQAAEERLKVPANQKCDVSIMQELSTLMTEINVFAKSYKMMAEVEEQEERDAVLAGRSSKPVRMVFDINDKKLDRRRFNLPTVNEVAVVYVQEDGDVPVSRSISAHPRDGGLVNIFDTDPSNDPMTYPLFFPRGELGWSMDMVREDNGTRKNLRVSQKDYYTYLLQVRKDVFNPILHGGNLLQQYAVDAWVKTEQNRLRYHRENQASIRAEEYQVLRDYVDGDKADGTPGRRVILPSSFQGSPRSMMQDYQDSMAIVARHGKPDFFLTFTCNPAWKEISENLLPGQTASDRPDLVARVFQMKVDELFDVLLKQHLLGEVKAYVVVVEWQKRGLPHIHTLLTMKDGHKPLSVDDIDRLICAELPDENTHPRLFDIVSRNMMHRPCGIANPDSPCMRNGQCSKRFPKEFANETKADLNGYPVYRRRDDGRFVKCQGCYLTNEHVVPYNADLLLRFNAHINLEVCAMVEAVKYLFKYVYKGSDRAALRLTRGTDEDDEVNEIDKYLDCRYICAPEAFHHLFGFACQKKSDVIYRLAVHLPNRQSVHFQAGNEQSAVDRSSVKGTTLTAFFEFNHQFTKLVDEGADVSGMIDPRVFTYKEFPEKFTFQKTSGKWTERKRGERLIGRMYNVSPGDPERFAMRLLLLYTKGPTSFENLRTTTDDTGDVTVHKTFVEAARALGLLKDDVEYKKALEEAAQYQMPPQMRALFAALLAFNEIGDPQALWNEFGKNMSEDFIRKGHSADESEAMAYKDVDEKLSRLGKGLKTFVKQPDYDLSALHDPVFDYVDAQQQGETLYGQLNDGQRKAVDAILESLENPLAQRLFFIDGPGGSGKTFLYNCLYNQIAGKMRNVVCTAWTGIASTLLPEGRTSASLFKLDINKDCGESSHKQNTAEGKKLKDVDVIIWDECSMIPKKAFETVDETLKFLTGVDEPFGGKIMVLGGDFRQILPVVRRGGRSDTVGASIKTSHLWPSFETHRLTANMRVTTGDKEWIEFLLRVGDGTENDRDERVTLPDSVLETGDLIASVFGDTITRQTDLSESAILAPKNVEVSNVNQKVLDRMEGHVKQFYSRDEICDDTNSKFITTEFLNSIQTTSLPPHQLSLKKGSVVMLLRNLDVSSGLCNGTRLIVQQFGQRTLQCTFAVGARKGEPVIIPRIDCYDDKNLAFRLKRTQFPVRLAFALSINKSQGQSFGSIGLWLKDDVFTHGQFYVALSRVRSKEGLHVKSANSSLLNVVYREIL